MTTALDTRRRRPSRQRHLPLQILLAFLVVYFLIPFWWVIVNSSKDAPGLFGGGNTLWFADRIDYLGNLQQLFTYDNGAFVVENYRDDPAKVRIERKAQAQTERVAIPPHSFRVFPLEQLPMHEVSKSQCCGDD